MRTFMLISLFLLANVMQTYSFCGFYVAKADAQLFNKSSQVIIARDGTQVAITMSSDFEGDVKDFAMVVPVAEVLKRNQIRIADQKIFDKLDAYSGPRLVEYHDANPCEPVMLYDSEVAMSAAPRSQMSSRDKKESADELGVTILESYTVGEYDIMILSAAESNGLEVWLKQNGYKIPQKASDVLEPYIKSDMKFFVVKVNLENFKQQGFDKLRPIQMSFHSDKFMLPIRLGMANANGDQDLIIYSFSKKGRIESTNYRTVEIPSNQQIPLNIKNQFGQFYKSLFDKAWAQTGKNAVMVEYAWDLSSNNYVKCDPCATTPPTYAELRESGVFWVNQQNQGRWGGANYAGDVFMTRLHVRYNRQTFPQDLLFQTTPNKASFQGRYILTHPAQGDLTCDQGQNYLKNLHERRLKEVQNLASLTDLPTANYQSYITEYDHLIKGGSQPYLEPIPKKNKDKGGWLPLGGINMPNGWYLFVICFGLIMLLGWFMRNRIQVLNS